MNHRRFLRSCFLLMLAPDTGAGSGGVSRPATLADALTAYDSAVSAATAAEGARAKAAADLDAAATERDAAKAESQRLQAQFDAATKTAADANTSLATVRGELAALATERDTARTSLATAAGNVTRLETLCGLKGIDASSAVPAEVRPAAGAAGTVTEAEFEIRMKACKNHGERNALITEMTKAAKEGRIRKN